MGVLTKIFTWWNGATIGTLLYIMRKGAFVGEDKQGNKFYQEKSPKNGQARRWVVYNGTAEASRISPDWHGWLHYTFDAPPTTAPFSSHTWEKPHIPNVTGTPYAYHPQGSLAGEEERPHATGDYEAWKPNDGAAV